MPKRSEREQFGQDIFEGNPFKGKSLDSIYHELQWGNRPRKRFPINAPEPLIHLGQLACLYSDYTTGLDEETTYLIGVGTKTNHLYLVPFFNGRPIPKIPPVSDSGWEHNVCRITRTDYVSKKGDKIANYYYHKHERPFPKLSVHDNGSAILIPSSNKMRRSYAVIREGIVG